MRVVITGAAGVLGAAVARGFLSAGANLALMDHAARPMTRSRARRSSHVFLDGIDLTDLAQARHAMDTAASRLGGIDVLVNIAGGFRWETIADGSLETWDFLYAINLKTALCACKAALAYFPADNGRIVNVGAAATAKAGTGNGGLYRLEGRRRQADRSSGRGVEGQRDQCQCRPTNHH